MNGKSFPWSWYTHFLLYHKQPWGHAQTFVSLPAFSFFWNCLGSPLSYWMRCSSTCDVGMKIDFALGKHSHCQARRAGLDWAPTTQWEIWFSALLLKMFWSCLMWQHCPSLLFHVTAGHTLSAHLALSLVLRRRSCLQYGPWCWAPGRIRCWRCSVSTWDGILDTGPSSLSSGRAAE